MRLDQGGGRRWRGRLVWLLLLSASVPGAAAASACTASDPSLGLTKYSDGRYYVTSNSVLATVCRQCQSIDYLWIGACADCTDDTLNTCTTLTSITGKGTAYGFSLYIGNSPLVTSLAGLRLARVDEAGEPEHGGLQVHGVRAGLPIAAKRWRLRQFWQKP